MPKVRGEQGRRRRGRPLLWSLVGVTLVLVVLAAVYAFQARSAYVHLSAAQARIADLRDQVVAGDQPAAGETAEALSDDTSEARTAVAGPHWSALTALPWVGPNVDAVQTVTETVDALAADAVPALLEAAEGVDPANLAPRDGRIPLAPIQDAAPHVRTAHQEVTEAADRVGGIDTDTLHDRLQDPVIELSTTLKDLSDQTSVAVKAADLLPPMLGADGPRTYLLLTQNNAEPRALGGIPGAVIVVRANDGRIRLVEQRAAGEFGNAGEPVLPLTVAERALFGTQLGRYMQNVTATPDFPRAARLAHAMWRRGGGGRLDGVASVDPVALERLLGATGPVTLPGGIVLDGENAAAELLNRVYLRHPDPQVQDAFFAAAAKAVFEQLVAGGADARATSTALAEAAGEGRLLLWSKHRSEQQILQDSPMGGSLTGRDDGRPVVGVFVHDRTAAKMGFYERVTVRAQPTSCESGESAELAVTVTVRNRSPRDLSSLPGYVTGAGHAVPEGHLRSEIYLYAPRGGLVRDTSVGDHTRGVKAPDAVSSMKHAGLHVVSREVQLPPRGRVTLRYRIGLDDPLAEPPAVRLTPGPGEATFRYQTFGCD